MQADLPCANKKCGVFGNVCFPLQAPRKSLGLRMDRAGVPRDLAHWQKGTPSLSGVMAVLIGLAGLMPLEAAPVGKTRYDHGDPSPLEQWVLEMVNRARENPAGEAKRCGIPLNDGLTGAARLTAAPKQALAFNPNLLAASRKHSRWMLDHNTFSHFGEAGRDSIQRMAAAGYPFSEPGGSGENIGWEGKVVTIRTPEVDFARQDWPLRPTDWMMQDIAFGRIRDGEESEGTDVWQWFLPDYLRGQDLGGRDPEPSPQPDRSLIPQIQRNLFLSKNHRPNLLNADHDEVGIGLVAGSFTYLGKLHAAWMLTQNFAASAASPRIDGPLMLGVVYDDHNKNGVYDPGEGKPGVTITVEPGAFFAVSSSSGGYAIPLGTIPPATVTVTANDGIGQPIASTVQVRRDQNIKIDVLWPSRP